MMVVVRISDGLVFSLRLAMLPTQTHYSTDRRSVERAWTVRSKRYCRYLPFSL